MSSPRSLQDVPVAAWQWRDPLTRFVLISIIFTWGFLLELCGEQPEYSIELQYLMSFGSFILAIIIGTLAQATFAHIFAYVQGYFLLKKQGIPLHAIMSGEQTPARILSACMAIFKNSTKGDKKQRYNKFYQISIYACTLMIYVASVGVGGYASSKLGMPYVFYSAPLKWVQMPSFPDQKVRVSLNNAFLPKNFLSGVFLRQYTSLALWVDKTRGDVNEVAFLPFTHSNRNKAIEDGNLRDTEGLLKWRVEAEYDNINMQYITSQCDIVADTCDSGPISRGSITTTEASKENKTLSWEICDLLNDTGSIKLVCSITLKEGVFPRVVIAFPDTEPRDEHLSEVIFQKNELKDLNELRDELFATMEMVFSRPSYKINNDLLLTSVIEQLVNGWTCEAGNTTCAQIHGSSAAVQYVGALLDIVARLYSVDNGINVDEWVGNSTSIGSVTASHKVCIGGNNPMSSIGLMIAVPLVMLIVELLPLLYNNKVWWLASDIGFKHIALLRSTAQGKIDFPECTTRPDETPSKTVVWFNDKSKGLEVVV